MKLFDEKFRQHKAQYVLQSLLAALTVLIILLLLDSVPGGALIAALGASSFIAFSMPWKVVARPRYLLGGYLVGVIIGCSFHFLEGLAVIQRVPFVGSHSEIVFGAASVGLAIFIMVVTDTEHPPAAGITLGLVLLGNHFTLMPVLVVLVGIICISLLKSILRPVMIDLL